MDYSHISNFLERFKKVLFKKEELNKIVAQVISETISFPIEEKILKIKGVNIYVEASPILKNEILIHKEKILKKLKSLVTDYSFNDIK